MKNLTFCILHFTFALTLAVQAKTVWVDEFAKPEAVDDTAAFQAAIDSGADEVIVPNRGKPWIVMPVFGRSNLTLKFEKGAVVEAKRGEFRGVLDSVLKFDCCTNVTVSGYGATLRMHKWDYHAAPYKRSEWRNGLSFLSCVDVKVEGLTIEETGGDGIYLGVNTGKDPERTNFRVTIRDVVCERNNRQGISVISAEDLLIENCDLNNTYGASPEAGIDFEPNHPDQRFVNCRMKNCRMRNNMGSGVEFWITRFNASTRPVSILIEDCETECNNEEIRFRDSGREYGADRIPPTGTVTLRNCTFRNMRNEYIYAAHETDRGIRLVIEGCTFIDDPNPPRQRVKQVSQLRDDAPGKMKEVPAMTQTGWVGYAVCVDCPRTVTVKAKMGKVRPMPTRKGKPKKGLSITQALDVLDPEGKKVASVELLPPDKYGEVDWKLDLPAAGVYSFGGFANREVTVLAADAPLAIDVTMRGHVFIKAEGDLYAYVPAGTERIVVTANGKSRQDRMSLAILDPSGQIRSKRTWIESCERYSFRDPKEGLWKFELRKPHVGNFSAYGFDVIGAVGYLFLDPNRTWR